MRVRRLRSNQKVLDNRNHVALARGPIVYCVEQADHTKVPVYDIGIAKDSEFETHHNAELLGGVTVLETDGMRLDRNNDSLYQEEPFTSATPSGKTTLKAIPYHVWANRDAGAMRVWLPEV